MSLAVGIAPSGTADRVRPATVGGLVATCLSVVALFLMSGAVLGPLFMPDQSQPTPAWMRLMWLPVYAFVVAACALQTPRLMRFWPGLLVTAPLLLLAFVSVTWSINEEATLRRAIAITATTLFGFYLAARYSWRHLLEMFAGLLFTLGLASAVVCLIAPGFGLNHDTHPGAWEGLWYQKNALGAMMAIGTLACIASAVLSPRRRPLWSCGAAVCGLLVLLSTSTTSLLGLVIAVGGSILLAFLRGRGAFAVAAAWGALVVAIGAWVLLRTAPELFFDAVGKDSTLTGRTDIWSAAMRQVADRPLLGYGYGAFWETKPGPVGFLRREVDWTAPNAHNGWLELLLGLGWTGLVAFAMHYVLIAGAALTQIWRGPQAYWVLLSTVLFGLFSITESTILEQNDMMWVFYIATTAKLLAWRPAPDGEANP